MRIFQVDAFTDTRYTGNPATVVLDANGESDDTLAAIAREFAHAEVAFVLAPLDATHDVRLRFFNRRKEAPFVGHATIAAHAVLHAVGSRPTGLFRQLSGTGIVEIRMDTSVAPPDIQFRQGAPDLDAALPLETTLRVASALGLPGAELHPALPARIARKGSSRLLVPVAHERSLAALTPRLEMLLSLGQELGAEGFFAFAVTGGAGGASSAGGEDSDNGAADAALSTDARMFCPALGIPEDPVSGNAHAMLAAYLWQHGEFEGRELRFVGRQGSYMNRPGLVTVALEVDGARVIAARIGGSAVIVSEGTLA